MVSISGFTVKTKIPTIVCNIEIGRRRKTVWYCNELVIFQLNCRFLAVCFSDMTYFISYSSKKFVSIDIGNNQMEKHANTRSKKENNKLKQKKNKIVFKSRSPNKFINGCWFLLLLVGVFFILVQFSFCLLFALFFFYFCVSFRRHKWSTHGPKFHQKTVFNSTNEKKAGYSLRCNADEHWNECKLITAERHKQYLTIEFLLLSPMGSNDAIV